MSTDTYSAASVRQARERLLEAGVGAHGLTPRTLNVPPVIERSWRRSFTTGGGYDPTATPAYHPFSEPAGRFQDTAETVLARWAESLADMRVALLVSDRSGRILARKVGDPSHARRLDKVSAAEGFEFSESALGTNGLGTAIEERSAVFVRGAEHVNDRLQTLACAGAPIHDPLSQRVIGSLALASPVGASHPAMLAIAKQAARDLQDALLNTAPLELQALLARFADGTARHRVLAIGRGGVLASTGALPMLSAERHVTLWDELQAHHWQGDVASVLLADRPSTARRIVNRAGESIYLVELPEDEPTAAPEPTRLSRLAAHLDVLGRSSGCIAIHGPRDSGKTLLAQLWLRERDRHDPVVIDAPAFREPGAVATAVQALSTGTSVVVRSVESLTDADFPVLQQLAGAADPVRSARVVFCVADDLTGVVVDFLGRQGPRLDLPALRDDPDRVIGLAVRLAQEHSVTLSPALLQALSRWDWPGGASELRVLIAAMVAYRPVGTVLDIDLLPVEMRTRARQLRGIAASEYRAIDAALREADGNRSRAAEILGIGRTTLYRKLRAYGLDGQNTLIS